MAEPLLAAAVQIDITPPVGTQMAGYGARTGTSVGLHDPLLGQVLLLQLGSQRLVLITLDLIGVGLDLTSRVRSGITEAIAVPSESIMLSCTHTHAGPSGLLPEEPGLRPPGDSALQGMLVRKLVGAARWAQNSLQAAQCSTGRGWVKGVGANRNDPQAGPEDDEVIVLRVDSADGTPLAVWINYGCHATVLGESNLWLSADFPGAARAALRRIYPHTVFLYANGASGDVSTRFTRRAQSFQEVQRLGHLLAGAVLQTMLNAEPRPVSALGALTMPVYLRRRPHLSLGQAQQHLEDLQAQLAALRQSLASHGDIRRAETRVRGAVAEVARAQLATPTAGVMTELQALRVGELGMIGLPGEPFTQTVLDIKRASPWPVTAVVSYANDEVGYFPDDQAVSAGTYEALKSPFGAEAAQELFQVALRSLGALRGQPS
jgi:hypothetical protein